VTRFAASNGGREIPFTLLDLDTENKARGSLKNYFNGAARKVNIHTPAGEFPRKPVSQAERHGWISRPMRYWQTEENALAAMRSEEEPRFSATFGRGQRSETSKVGSRACLHEIQFIERLGIVSILRKYSNIGVAWH
jgi:hypothetical protein